MTAAARAIAQDERRRAATARRLAGAIAEDADEDALQLLAIAGRR